MRKIANNIFIIYLLTCCYGCATVKPEVFNPQKKMDQLLLPLEIHILDPNIEEHYFSGEKNIVSDDRIMEARYIIYKDFKKNIFQESDKTYGFAFCHIKRDDIYANWLWIIPYAATLGTITLFGFPGISQTAEIEVELKILDLQKNLIARYSGVGKDTEYCAMYWGYEGFGGAIQNMNNTLSQVVNATALTNAFLDLKKQLQKDAFKINNQLSKSNSKIISSFR